MGYANAYGHYVTTPEEYDAQMYEGASTLFGRWQLPALQQHAARLATAMRDGRQIAPGPPAPDLSRPATAASRPRPPPTPPSRTPTSARRLSFAWDGQTLIVEFVGVHPSARSPPRRHVLRGATPRRPVLAPDRRRRRLVDAAVLDPRSLAAHTATVSKVRIEWRVPPGTPRGRYRLVYRGDTGQVKFEARSQEFDLGTGEEL